MNESPPGAPRIAIVEDEAVHAEAIRRAFADAGSPAGITVAGSLREFRDLVAAAPPDIALMDLNLPDGLALEMLTAPPEAGAFPILVMTSYGNEQLAVEAIKAGALDYVVKSAELFADLPRIVARALREWHLLRERARALDDLRESETRFRQMAEAMGEIFWLRDIRTRKILYVNPAFEALWGLPCASLLADPDIFVSSIHPEDRHRVRESAYLSLGSGIPFSFSEEFRIVRPDGSVRWVQTRIRPVFDGNRELIRYAGIAEDITAQHEAQQALLESEEKYRGLTRQFHALLDAIPEDITVQTTDLKVIWANRAAAAKFGREPSDLSGQSCHLLRFGRSEPCDGCPVQQSLRTRAPSQTVMLNPAGRVFETRAIPVVEDDEIINVINVVRDITEQSQMEEQLRQAQKMESIGTLAGGVAHDFNNILTSIIGYGHMALIKAGAGAPERPYIQNMLDGADRAAKLTDGLLSFSRKQLITKKPADLIAIVRAAKRVITGFIGAQIEYTATLPGGEIPVLVDTNQIEQALINLATNARDAMPHGGAFTVAVERVLLDEAAAAAITEGAAGSYAVIRATDTGTGMTEGIRKRIFEPFYTTKEVGKGTGLGLSIIHGIVKQHEGFIDLLSEPGKGTTVNIYLPTIVPDEGRKVPEAADAPSGRGTETILLAEDESAVRVMTKTILEEYGYRVLVAVDGEDAVRVFRESLFREGGVDLLLFDLVMPKMGGKDAFEKIRQIRPGVRALFVSGYSDDFVRRREVLGPEMSVLLKPVSPIDLLHKVRSLLDTA